MHPAHRNCCLKPWIPQEIAWAGLSLARPHDASLHADASPACPSTITAQELPSRKIYLWELFIHQGRGWQNESFRELLGRKVFRQEALGTGWYLVSKCLLQVCGQSPDGVPGQTQPWNGQRESWRADGNPARRVHGPPNPELVLKRLNR